MNAKRCTDAYNSQYDVLTNTFLLGCSIENPVTSESSQFASDTTGYLKKTTLPLPKDALPAFLTATSIICGMVDVGQSRDGLCWRHVPRQWQDRLLQDITRVTYLEYDQTLVKHAPSKPSHWRPR